MQKIISVLCLLVFSLFSSITYCLADEMVNESNNNLSKESKISIDKNKNNIDNDNSNTSNEDLFGDEQAFPFIAGFGKNSAH